MEDNERILLEELNYLFLNNEVTSSFEYEISQIEENFGEYCLTLMFDNFEINGIFTKTKEKLMEKQIISSHSLFYLDKSNEEIKVYVKYLVLKNRKEKNPKQSKNTSIKKNYNFKPEFLKSSSNKLKLFEGELNEENALIYLNQYDNIIKLFDPISYEYYTMDYKYIKNRIKLNKNDFIYLKFHLIKEKEIICHNLTFIQKADEFQIFRILDEKIINKNLFNFYEVNPIEDNDEKTLTFLFAKVILKNIKEQYILIIDKFNRIVRLKYNQIPDLDLFDLLLIINCQIKKDEKAKFYYILKLKKNSIIYKSKNLIFNKTISINNYSLLNIIIPDYKEKHNYYNQIIISDFREINIKSNQQIYIFKFNNEIFNEIVPFNIRIKNKSEKIDFKFLIVNNLMTNINIFLNYVNNDKCAVEYCYYNYYDEVPNMHKITINDEDFLIQHYNSYDNSNIIGFILINVPPDENTNKIKKSNNKEIISSQIWFTAQKEKNNINYKTTQILDVEEAMPKKYLSYNLKSKKYSKFQNFYYNMTLFLKEWSSSQYQAYKYFEVLNKEYERIDKNEFELIINNNNIDFIPESADFYTFKIFVNLLLFDSMKVIKKDLNNNLQNVFDSWNDYLEKYINLIEKLNDLGKLLSYHQKIRIINSYNYDIFKNNYPYNYSSRFLYIDEQYLQHNNSYFLAFKFNIDIINNLTQKSALTKGFMQLDSYILKNYFINDNKVREEKTYSLLNEPISLMKYHLLMNYENFIFIKSKDEYNKTKIKTIQDNSNRVTFINEKILFNNYNSECLKGKDNALPISMEFFHENSHSKKNSKNNSEKSPLSCFINNETIILEAREDGRYIDSIIGDDKFIEELKNPNNKLGELMKVEYFIKEDFHKLNEKYKELIKLKKTEIQKLSHNKIIESYPLNINKNIRNEKIKKNKNELKTLEDFEEYYLINKEFIYPDSIPSHIYPLGEKLEISQGEKEYLEKYKDDIRIEENNNLRYKRKISF